MLAPPVRSDHLDQLAPIAHQFGHHAPQFDRFAAIATVLAGILVPNRCTGRLPAMHPAHRLTPHRRRSAPLPAPFRSGSASACPVHGQFALHEVDPLILPVPLPRVLDRAHDRLPPALTVRCSTLRALAARCRFSASSVELFEQWLFYEQLRGNGGLAHQEKVRASRARASSQFNSARAAMT